jgi:hypothetical protein
MTSPSRTLDRDEMTVFTWCNGKITAIRAFHDTAASGIAAPGESAGSREALFQRPRRCAVYDAIVVGAWCAGSPTAMRLARQGYRVLLVDRATLPSDMALSTHLIWQAGCPQLQGWGLLDKVQTSHCLLAPSP